MSVGGYVGWWTGGYFGLDLMATFWLSTAGSAASVYVTWRIIRDHL
jgi:hypothetical protein